MYIDFTRNNEEGETLSYQMLVLSIWGWDFDVLIITIGRAYKHSVFVLPFMAFGLKY